MASAIAFPSTPKALKSPLKSAQPNLPITSKILPMKHSDWLRLCSEGEQICAAFRQQGYQCKKQTRRLCWQLSSLGQDDYILTFAPAPLGDWSLIPNNNSPVREQMWAIVQNALAPKLGQATTYQRVQQPEDYSRPWAIVRPKSLETGRVDLDSPNLKKANVLNVNLLARNLNRLVNLGYTDSVAKEGKTMEARTEVEKNKLKQLNEELNELAIHLNIVIEDVLKQISTQELDRIYQAVSELFRCHLSFLEKGANNIAPNIAIKFPESELSQVNKKLTFSFRFQAGFAITKGTWQKPVQVEIKKRIWYTLWIREKTIYETEYQTLSSDNAQIPSVEDLLTNWIIQAKGEDSERVNQVAHWLLEQIDCLKKNVDKIQNDIIDRYQERLDKANQEINLDYEKQRNIWQPMEQKSQKLAEEFSSLMKVWKVN